VSARLAALLSLVLGAGCAEARGTVLRLRDGGPGGRDGAVDVPDDGGPGGSPGDGDGGGESPLGSCRIDHDVGFIDQFDQSSLDPRRWFIAHGNTPIAGERPTGGFVRDNVRLEDGKLVLSVRGDQYTGPVRGIDAAGQPRADGKRSAAAIATRDLFMSGTYQWEGRFGAPAGVKMVLLVQRDDPADGVIAYTAPGIDGLVRSYDFAEAFVSGPRAAPQRVQVTLPFPLDDGQYHQLRFDWHSGAGMSSAPDVDFWEGPDNLEQLAGNAPARAARAWLVAFVPDGVAAAFDTVEIPIETAFITTFGEVNDRCADGELSQGILVAP
jgi:hypothetical protein